MLFTNDFAVFEVILAIVVVYFATGFLVKKISMKRKGQILSRYGAVRKQSLELQKTLSHQVLSDTADRATLNGQISYADFYRQLKSNHVYNLSDKYVSKVKNSNNPLFLNKAERNLQEQEEKLKSAEQLISGTMLLQ